MDASLWRAAAYQPDEDWDDGEPDYEEGCPHCEQVKAGRLDVSERYYWPLSFGYVHSLLGAVEDIIVPCQPELDE